MTFLRVVMVVFVVTGSLLAQAAVQSESRPAAAPSTPSPNPRPQTTPATQPPTEGAGAVSREQAPAADNPQPSTQEVPENAAVITIPGVCSSPTARNTAEMKPRASSKPAECKTVITRAQWEHLLAAIGRPLPPQFRRQAAEQYANLLGMAAAARKEGLDGDPEVQERLEIQRMQALGSAYVESMRKKYSQVPDTEVDKYYNDHKSQFETMTAKRIYIPKGGMVQDKKMDDAAVKALAQKIRDRAIAGENFEKLQKEAFEQTGNKGTPPAVELGEKRRGGLPPQQEEQLFQLKAGEVSKAYEEPSGFFVYQVEKTGIASLEQVKSEILRVIESEKMREAMDKLKASLTPTLNEAYFGPPTPPPGTAPTPSGTSPNVGAGATPQKPAAAGSSQPASQPNAPSPSPK